MMDLPATHVDRFPYLLWVIKIPPKKYIDSIREKQGEKQETTTV
jgi:hypothetical protein